MAGLGGAYLTTCQLPYFTDNITQYRGFIAIAVVMLASWNPARDLFGALLFGGAMSFASLLMTRGFAAGTSEFLLMLPYVMTIIVLALVAKKALPSAFGLPYRRETK